MEDSINVISRFQNIEGQDSFGPLSREEAETLCLCPGDIFWKKSDGKLYRLRMAGDPVDFKNLERYYSKNAEIYCHYIVNKNIAKTWAELLDNYLMAEAERHKIHYRDQLIASLRPTYWDGTDQGSWLTVVTSFHQKLFRKKLYELSFEESPDHFRRSTLVGTLSVIGAMSLGYHDDEFLKDLYQLAFFQGISLKNKMTYDLAQALDGERRSKEIFTKEKAKLSDRDAELLFSHVKSDYSLVKDEWRAFFTFDSVLKMLNWQHEQPFGGGFPFKTNQDELSDIELWVCYAGRLFPMRSFQYDAFDGKSAIKSYFDTYKKNKDEFFFMGRRVFQLIENLWSRADFVKFEARHG